jgi:hypothetical protein
MIPVTTIERERLAVLKDRRRIAAEHLDKVADQIRRTGTTAILRKWRADLSGQIIALDRLIAKTRGSRRHAKQ